MSYGGSLRPASGGGGGVDGEKEGDVADTEGDEDGFWEDIEDSGLDYLALCCPACFGAREGIVKGGSEPDVIVCLDACFTQKRRNPVRGRTKDPPLRHPMSAFLTREEMKSAENYVEDLRPSRAKAPRKETGSKETVTGPDMVEEGMKVPKSVLDACLDSFKAADEKRTKASTKYFADTGLMALLCRHDRVLWLANMTTAGERQYFAIALILKLFKHLPKDTSVGIMYDIGCQLERSCRKWGMMVEITPRISWAVSVFHAYGHQWPCQLIYHPRKRKGFGLSDGEGCERFWSAIEFLIPTLRVSGYHQRLFTLDVQVSYLRGQSLLLLGQWIKRKFEKCRAKRNAALEVLGDLTYSEDELRREWESQVGAQTKPLVVATGGLAKKSIKVILSLMEFRSNLQKDIQKIDRKVSRVQATDGLDDLVESRGLLASRVEEVSEQIDVKRKALGVRDERNLKDLIKDKYLELRLKALAVKERLRAKLQGRKFEFERVDRAYQRVTANESSLLSHIQKQVGRHQGTIVSTMKKYNDMCRDLEKMIREGKAPVGAISPRPIPKEELYSMDVDAPIWDDSGLNDVASGEIPGWLGNDEIRRGIIAWLDLQRCDEELVRLKQECLNIHTWARREWDALHKALEETVCDNIKYQLHKRQAELSKLITTWRGLIRAVAPGVYSLDWTSVGKVDITTATIFDTGAGSDSEESDVSQDSELEADDIVVQALESMNLLGDEEVGVEGSDQENTVDSDFGSPRKRRRE
ncbi:hypothetical protein D9611_014648 [Ephemerocybe angulata]|uniref:Uncharacterized protein n=1 Tax=Ephemerocybe angulata TaxID=980116 RepID=A0A8H5FI35_9AGAR|nr:hypothetical protein D9611_014648 [Tulosesus angulatus]